MKITPATSIPNLNSQLPKKQLTVNGCCDNINITNGNTTIMFGKYKYLVNVFFCKNCGSKKSTSSITHVK